ncbi:MAG: TIGR00296 family protein [Candidatus Verstraetearchaeota archaeon]|nr:TIGR00296 family protein [Candidatus Verstraetearchaeota archaeon]
MYTIREGEFLVRLARSAVETYLSTGTKISPPAAPSPRLLDKSGVFVTLEKVSIGVEGRSLRGCIGYPEPLLSLVEATVDSALGAAFNDPRFPPVEQGELGSIVFEVSILTPPIRVETSHPKELPTLIRVGRDGLIIESGFYRGLLLPQVPVEYGWDEETFLAECCMKAGLPPDAWLSRKTAVYRFTAEIFAEATPRGEVVQKPL